MMGSYIPFKPKLTMREQKANAIREAKEKQEAEDRQIMEELLVEDAQNRLKAQVKAREEKELRHKNFLEVRKVQSEAEAKRDAVEVERRLELNIKKRTEVFKAIMDSTGSKLPNLDMNADSLFKSHPKFVRSLMKMAWINNQENSVWNLARVQAICDAHDLVFVVFNKQDHKCKTGILCLKGEELVAEAVKSRQHLKCRMTAIPIIDYEHTVALFMALIQSS